MAAPRHRQGHIAQCLGRILACRGSATAAVAAGPGGRRLTGAEFVDGVRSLAAGVADRGVRPGHVVAAVALNSVEYVQLFLAVTYAGAIIAPLNYRWSFEEAAQAVELVRPTAFAFDGAFSSWALRLMEGDRFPSIGLYLLLGDPCRTGRAAAGCAVPIADVTGSLGGATAAAAMEPVSAPDDVALICFTSGTTGRPKGVAISHTSLIVQSLAKIAIVGYGEDDVYLHTAPLCHIGGVSSCMAVLMAGGCHVLAPKFDARSAFAAIQEHGVTCFITVPAIMADLLSYARKEEMAPDCGKTTVTKILNGGGGLPLHLVNAASQSFPRAAIFSAYGMTEACSSLTFMALTTPKLQEPEPEPETQPCGHHGGVCVGKPAPHVEIRIGMDDDGTTAGSSPTGNVLTRGLHTMVGYWANGKADSSECDRNGWLDTGDTGWVDEEGNLWLLGRHKGRIKTGGENVYPEEVESVLSQHPGVARAVVVGVPDSRLGERVVACVSVKDGWNWVDARAEHEHRGGGKVSPQILHGHCRTKELSRFKVPRSYYQWRQPFPVTTTGKIRREELKRELLAAIRLPSNL